MSEFSELAERLKKPESRARVKRVSSREKERQWQRVRAAVKVRDGGRCRVCRTRDGVDVHHIRFRSAGREDSTENTCLLCKPCHDDVHAYRLVLTGNGNKKLQIERQK